MSRNQPSVAIEIDGHVHLDGRTVTSPDDVTRRPREIPFIVARLLDQMDAELNDDYSNRILGRRRKNDVMAGVTIDLSLTLSACVTPTDDAKDTVRLILNETRDAVTSFVNEPKAASASEPASPVWGQSR